MIEFWFSTIEILGWNALNASKFVRFELSRAISIWIRVNSQQCSVSIPKRISNNTQFDGYLNLSNRTETISAQVIVSRDELVGSVFVSWKHLDFTTMDGTMVIGDNFGSSSSTCKRYRFTWWRLMNGTGSIANRPNRMTWIDLQLLLLSSADSSADQLAYLAGMLCEKWIKTKRSDRNFILNSMYNDSLFVRLRFKWSGENEKRTCLIWNTRHMFCRFCCRTKSFRTNIQTYKSSTRG